MRRFTDLRSRATRTPTGRSIATVTTRARRAARGGSRLPLKRRKFVRRGRTKSVLSSCNLGFTSRLGRRPARGRKASGYIQPGRSALCERNIVHRRDATPFLFLSLAPAVLSRSRNYRRVSESTGHCGLSFPNSVRLVDRALQETRSRIETS